MSADYDLYSNTVTAVGTEENVLMDGTNFTAAVLMGDWKSIIFNAQLNAAALYRDLVWSVQDSSDGSSWSAVDASLLSWNAPSSVTASSRVWHIGYHGKKDYVRAALNVDGGTTTGALVVTTQTPISLGAGELTSSSTTATVAHTAHGLVVGQYITVTGAVQTPYNVTNARVVTVADADHFTYTFAGSGTSPATGTIIVTPSSGWTVASLGADKIASISVGDDALSGDYVVTPTDIGASAHSIIAAKIGNTGTGTPTISNMVAAVLSPYVNQVFKAKCTAAASNAGTFTVYLPDGTALTPTVPVGAVGATIQIGGANAFKLVVTDATDWVVGDELDITFDDLGVNAYKVTRPNGTVLGYPVGGTAYTSTEVNFTIPDTTVAVTSLSAVATVTVTEGDAYGHISVVKGNPLSGPLNSASITDKPQVLNS